MPIQVVNFPPGNQKIVNIGGFDKGYYNYDRDNEVPDRSMVEGSQNVRFRGKTVTNRLGYSKFNSLLTGGSGV